MKKNRVYVLKYWCNTTKIETWGAFKNYNAAYRWLYKNEYKPLTVSFKGWFAGMELINS